MDRRPQKTNRDVAIYRNRRPEVFLIKGVLNICSIFTGEHQCRSAISIKLLCNFIEITLWHWCSPVHLLHIFRTPFLKSFLFIHRVKYPCSNKELKLNISFIVFLFFLFRFVSWMLFSNGASNCQVASMALDQNTEVSEVAKMHYFKSSLHRA